jgi:hypothetical protein
MNLLLFKTLLSHELRLGQNVSLVIAPRCIKIYSPWSCTRVYSRK